MARKRYTLLDDTKWYKRNTKYQILLIDYNDGYSQSKKLEPSVSWKTTLYLKSREEFDKFELDEETKNKLNTQKYPKAPKAWGSDTDTISSYLPSPGIVLDESKFINNAPQNNKKSQGNQNNILNPARILLRARKTSQLIAKTWDAYLQALNSENNYWSKFIDGEWENIPSDILDGLITRDIFLFSDQVEPDELDPDNLNGYYPLEHKSNRYVILPSHKGWQKIELSLLFAGQVYRKVKDDKYHQISQPILSTGEIISHYNLEVSWDRFHGELKELKPGVNQSTGLYDVMVPYPPIPSERNLSDEQIREWANASDDDGDFPFYKKNSKGLGFVSPPYPYLPLSCL